MIAALEESQGRFVDGFIFEVVDVDQHPTLEMEWGDKVPVLLDGGTEICHYFLDSERLVRHLGKPA